MSGAGAGNGVGSGGLPPDLPQADAADRPQQWGDAVRGALAVQADTVVTTTVALDLNAPAMLGTVSLRLGVVPDEMAAEGLDRHPAGLNDPTPSPDRMAPVDAAVAGQDAGAGDLRSPIVPSAALPPQLAEVLRAAGYLGPTAPAGATGPADAATAATPDTEQPGGLLLSSPQGFGGAGRSTAAGRQGSADVSRSAVASYGASGDSSQGIAPVASVGAAVTAAPETEQPGGLLLSAQQGFGAAGRPGATGRQGNADASRSAVASYGASAGSSQGIAAVASVGATVTAAPETGQPDGRLVSSPQGFGVVGRAATTSRQGNADASRSAVTSYGASGSSSQVIAAAAPAGAVVTAAGQPGGLLLSSRQSFGGTAPSAATGRQSNANTSRSAVAAYGAVGGSNQVITPADAAATAAPGTEQSGGFLLSSQQGFGAVGRSVAAGRQSNADASRSAVAFSGGSSRGVAPATSRASTAATQPEAERPGGLPLPSRQGFQGTGPSAATGRPTSAMASNSATAPYGDSGDSRAGIAPTPHAASTPAAEQLRGVPLPASQGVAGTGPSAATGSPSNAIASPSAIASHGASGGSSQGTAPTAHAASTPAAQPATAQRETTPTNWQTVAGMTLPFLGATPGTQPQSATPDRSLAAVPPVSSADPMRTAPQGPTIGLQPRDMPQDAVRQLSVPVAGRAATNPGDLAAVVAGAIAVSAVPAAHAAATYGQPFALGPAGLWPTLAPAASSRRAGRPADGAQGVVPYSERRAIPIDVAPVSAEVPSWRLDDTQALVTIGPAGTRSATLRAAELYRHLVDYRIGLAAIRPGEGFATWQGSPLWLSLAAIGKPAALGVLPGASSPGSVMVMRTEHGEWLVEHAGGPWRGQRARRHDAMAADDETLLLDVLYGLADESPQAAALQRFETARAALRFAGRAADPAGWRAQEAWALVARCCATAAMQQPEANAPVATLAWQTTLSVAVDGVAPAVVGDPLAVAPLARDRFNAVALSGDRHRLAGALCGLGRATLDRVRQGRIDAIDPIEALALAACLGRLMRRDPAEHFSRAADDKRAASPVKQEQYFVPWRGQ